MPYTRCGHCGGVTYSAAGWSSVEDCTRCGRALPPRPSVTRKLVFGSRGPSHAAIAAARARVEPDRKATRRPDRREET